MNRPLQQAIPADGGGVFYSTMRPHDWREVYAMGARMSSSTPRTGEFIDVLRQLAGRTEWHRD